MVNVSLYEAQPFFFYFFTGRIVSLYVIYEPFDFGWDTMIILALHTVTNGNGKVVYEYLLVWLVFSSSTSSVMHLLRVNNVYLEMIRNSI